MGFLRQGHQSPAVVWKYTGLQIQTSSRAVPIAILYGTNRISTNAIWTGGFYAVPQYQKGGGKGGGGRQLQGYTYYTSFLMGICEGPITNYRTSFVNQQQLWGLYGTGLEQATGGTTPQAPWGYLRAFFPGQALGYNGLAYVGAFNYNLGSTPNLPQFSFEIEGIASIWAGNVLNGLDSDPALIIQDFLTNAQYGVLFPAASIDATTLLGASGDSSYQTYCRASFLALSPSLINQEAANSILARWLQLTNTAAVWSGGKLKFIPYGDNTVSTTTSIGTVTFNPNVTPVYNLTDDDFIHEDGKDPLEVVRSDPYASYNWQRLQINARVAFYDAVPIDAWDQNAIELYGLRRASDITASEICDLGVGQIAAQLILQRQLYIRNTYNFKLSFEYCLLEPMDLVTVTDTALGLTNAAVRITAIEEDDSGLLSVTAEEFPGGAATAIAYPISPPTPNPTNQAVVPARVNAPVIFEPPAALTAGVAQVWAAVSGGVATAYKLAEDSSTGLHAATQAMLAPRAVGDTINFSIYAQAVERNKIRLAGDTGTATIGCEFDLAAGVTETPDAGITAATIRAAGGGQTAPVTITIASPAVVTWAANGLSSGQAVVFSTTGALPTGLTAGAIYYVIPTVPAGDTFNVAATPGGAAINTSGTQSGVHTGTADIWFQILISYPMAAAGAPTVRVELEASFGTTSYAGVTGDGVYVWGAEYAWTNAASGLLQEPTFLPAFASFTGATYTTSAVATPEGVPGIADPNWGGAFVWISTDNATYGQIGTVAAPARQGVLTAAMGATDTSLSVTLEESGGQLLSGTAADAQNGVTLCLVDNELLAYQTATLLAAPPPNSYTLSGLVRGFYGTSAAAHANGAPFARLDSAIFQYNLPSAFIGVALYMKFQSFNIFGVSVEDLSECAVYTYTPSGKGQPTGPVTNALLLGQNLDFGRVSALVAETDQWGIVTDGFFLAAVDLGAGIP